MSHAKMLSHPNVASSGRAHDECQEKPQWNREQHRSHEPTQGRPQLFDRRLARREHPCRTRGIQRVPDDQEHQRSAHDTQQHVRGTEREPTA